MKKFFTVVFILNIFILSACARNQAFNTQDQQFVEHMIPHHEQAVEMVKLVQIRGTDPEVAEIANRIGRQYSEIQLLRAWQNKWRDSIPLTGEIDSHNASHGEEQYFREHDSSVDVSEQGMVSLQSMEHLRTLQGNKLDQMFLTLMIAHHEGAIRAAQEELEKGKHPSIIAFARNVILVQQEEIQEMEQLLGKQKNG